MRGSHPGQPCTQEPAKRIQRAVSATVRYLSQYAQPLDEALLRGAPAAPDADHCRREGGPPRSKEPGTSPGLVTQRVAHQALLPSDHAFAAQRANALPLASRRRFMPRACCTHEATRAGSGFPRQQHS
jgi:hypothetical protein